MKVYLDDIRMPTGPYCNCWVENGNLVISSVQEFEFEVEPWMIFRTAEDLMRVIADQRLKINYISFDHDLGESRKTGYDVATAIEHEVAMGRMSMPQWNVHSANPVGRKRIEAAMISASKYSLEL